MDKVTFRLHKDLVWRTLSFIAELSILEKWDTDEPSSLTTLRHASQVCSAWRDLILSTTSWWGRLIDLDCLDQKSDYWRFEVLRRSGQSALFITGSVDHRTDFVEILFKEHWARIKVLYLYSVMDIFHSVRFDLFQHFQRPAPSMEVFMIRSGSRYRHSKRYPQNFRLFSNSAPSLRWLCPSPLWTENFIQAPFIAHLRILDLSECHIDLGTLLDALKRMRFLEELRNVSIAVQEEVGGTTSFEYQQVTVPNLRYLSVDAPRVDAWLDVLSSITPASKCILHTSLRQEKTHTCTLNTADVVAICRILSIYIKRYIISQRPTEVLLRFLKNRFAFHHAYKLHTRDIFSFFLDWDTLPAHSTLILMRTFAACDLKNTTFLRLEISEGCDFDPTDPTFMDFMVSSLQSTETLNANPPAIEFLLRLDLIDDTIFPALRTVLYPHSPNEQQSHLLAKFLSWRWRIGCPIEVLNITQSRYFADNHRDFRFLENIAGLKVVWTVHHSKVSSERMEYICGSSNPNVLHFQKVDSSG